LGTVSKSENLLFEFAEKGIKTALMETVQKRPVMSMKDFDLIIGKYLNQLTK